MQRALDAVEAAGDDVTSVAVAEELEAAQVRECGRVALREINQCGGGVCNSSQSHNH